MSRDGWCTPRWLTDLLPEVDLDPCSNPRSTVKSLASYSLESGQDGLVLPWSGSVFVNPPYSNVGPWADKLADSERVSYVGFLVNVDPSTVWWKKLTHKLTYALMLHRRVLFDPPPGIRVSSNSRPQVLLMNLGFRHLLPDALLDRGDLWTLV